MAFGSVINIIYTAPLFLCILSLLSTQMNSKPLYYYCPNSTTNAPNSGYEANINLLLSMLSSNVFRPPENGFFNFSTAGNDTNNRVYSIFLCRGDVTTDQCHDCVATASKEILDVCPNRKRAMIWYDICYLHLANAINILSSTDTSLRIILPNTTDVTEQADRFMEVLGSTMNELANRAMSTDGSGKKFAAKEAYLTAFQKLYGLVQCTPDLPSEGCNTCLRDAIAQLPSCCTGKQGGRVLFPSCNIRYEFHPFFNITASTPLLPPPPPASSTVGNDMITEQSLQYDLRTIEAATNNFCNDNKIGEGGFGAVYKGTLPNGQEIAVKRLSKSSGQGEKEFKNEVVLVAKLQHRNLVRLLGFCLERQEKILIYEFVPNKSLDYFLFDSEKGKQLNWSRRYKIISGIARGILYLHEDSRLRVIHRDLKASNVLLDGDMNSKVSDFGMARIFCVDQTEGSTNRIVGTFGYMSPEYAMGGQFSVKSDMFSFGVSVLEITSGKKNSSFYKSYGPEGLLGYAWKHWRDGTPLELMDPILEDSYSRDEIIRCIHIGLLCVQEDMDARPSMPSVVHMLNSSLDTLPLPQQPPFSVRGRTELNVAKGIESCSLNEVSISELNPR